MILREQTQSCEGNPYLTENRLSKNKMWCAADNRNDTCYTDANIFLDSNFSDAVINKVSISL